MNAPREIQRFVARFHQDQDGQGVLFAALSLVVLIAFVSLVFNVGAAVGQRTRIQMTADAMVYTGAVIQANALSTIAWINSGMAQTYYNLMRYCVDLTSAATAAELQRRLLKDRSGQVDTGAWQATEAYRAYIEAKNVAVAQVPQALDFLRDLSRIQNGLALVAPEMAWDRMYEVGEANGAERMSIFGGQRMFPHPDGLASFLIERLPDGWRVTNLLSQDGEVIEIRLNGGVWTIRYSTATTGYTWEIWQTGQSPLQWRIRLLDASGDVTRDVTITETQAGWLVQDGSRQVQVEEVTRGGLRGIAITYQGVTTIIRRDQGHLYKWDEAARRWVDQTVEEVTVGDYTIPVHSSNAISVGGMTVYIGSPPSLSVGGAHINLDPNHFRVHVSAGGLSIGIEGFNPNDYWITYRGHSLTNGNATGRWEGPFFDSGDDLWWRHRLTELEADTKWQYDYQLMGVMLQHESNLERFAVEHAIRDRGEFRDPTTPLPEWTRWFDPTRGSVRNRSLRQRFTDSVTQYPGRHVAFDPSTDQCRDQTLFLTKPCPVCDSASGWCWDPVASAWRVCPACSACDYDNDGRTEVRVFLGEALRGDGQPIFEDTDGNQRLRIPVSYASPAPFNNNRWTRWPLVLTEDFFRWGLNVGAWRAAETMPMMFSREPNWGYVAISSARIGVSDAASDGEPAFYRFRFPSEEEREQWVETDLENLYRADVSVKLVSSRGQIADYDYNPVTLVGLPTQPVYDSPTSFLWRGIISGHMDGLDEASMWFDRRNGRSDFEMSERLANMTNRDNERFNYEAPEMEELIRH